MEGLKLVCIAVLIMYLVYLYMFLELQKYELFAHS